LLGLALDLLALVFRCGTGALLRGADRLVDLGFGALLGLRRLLRGLGLSLLGFAFGLHPFAARHLADALFGFAGGLVDQALCPILQRTHGRAPRPYASP